MNMTHINWDGYQFPIVDSEVRKVAYTDNNNTVAKFGFYNKNYIEIDDEGINFCQNCEDPYVANSSFLGTTTIKPDGGIYFNNSFTGGNLIFQTNMPNKNTALPTSSSAYDKDNILVCDENGSTQACFRYVNHETLGQGMRIKVRHKISGTVYDNGICLCIKPDGTRTVLINEPSQWRNALGIGGIGTLAQQMPATKSIASGTNTSLTSETFSAGTWAITYCAQFAANAQGTRRVWLAKNSTGGFWDSSGSMEKLAPPSSDAMLVGTTMAKFSSSTTLWLFAKHGGSTSLNVIGGIYALKIK